MERFWTKAGKPILPLHIKCSDVVAGFSGSQARLKQIQSQIKLKKNHMLTPSMLGVCVAINICKADLVEIRKILGHEIKLTKAETDIPGVQQRVFSLF